MVGNLVIFSSEQGSSVNAEGDSRYSSYARSPCGNHRIETCPSPPDHGHSKSRSDWMIGRRWTGEIVYLILLLLMFELEASDNLFLEV